MGRVSSEGPPLGGRAPRQIVKILKIDMLDGNWCRKGFPPLILAARKCWFTRGGGKLRAVVPVKERKRRKKYRRVSRQHRPLCVSMPGVPSLDPRQIRETDLGRLKVREWGF